MAINLLRHSPRSFIPHVQRAHQKQLVNNSMQMKAIIDKLKVLNPITTVKFDEGANAACRANNADICGREEAEPAEGGNLAKLQEQAGDGKEPRGSEASFFEYRGSSAEEFVAILLYRDYEKSAEKKKAAEAGPPAAEENKAGSAVEIEEAKNVAEPAPAAPAVTDECESALLDPRVYSVGISNKAHSKKLNSIQIIYLYQVVNTME